MAVIESPYVYEERSRTVRRMCAISAVMFFVSVASFIVGIIAVKSSDGEFPFSAGGAIVAGIMALLFSICPMCKYYISVQENDQPGSLYEGCCSWTMFIWGFLMLVGLPFGFVVNGAIAVKICAHPTKGSGCMKDSDTKMILAIITIILTLILMALTILIFVICCRNSCQETKYGPPNVHSVDDSPVYTRHTRARTGISEPNQLGSLSTVFNIDIGAIREPSAPPQIWTNNNAPRNSDSGDINNAHGSSDYIDNPPGYTEYMNNARDYTRRFETPPPTYHEAMENDPMETPL